jgi:hypothetical protein
MLQDAYVAQRCSEIESSLRYAANKSRTDPELGGHLASYISVLISGVVEDSIEHLVVERARKANDTQLQEFVRSSIGQQFRNPRSQDIANVLGRFSENYQGSYQRSVSRAAREALGSIVGNRMSLAHRGASQLSLTVNDVRMYFELIIEILTVVESILLSDNQANEIAHESPE